MMALIVTRRRSTEAFPPKEGSEEKTKGRINVEKAKSGKNKRE